MYNLLYILYQAQQTISRPSIVLLSSVLFQEHEIGVWVSRVIPDGNAANKGVQHGDQLAAINGNSSVHATIDEVATTISSTPNNMSVELTFLRYIGPLRPMPGSIIQEGFEVTDTAVSPGRGKKLSLFSKKKGTTTKTPPASPGRKKFSLGGSSPKSPQLTTQSPKYTHSPLKPPSSRGSSAAGGGSPYSSSSPKQSSSRRAAATGAAAPTIPSLAPEQKKKKKGLGKILGFKKKS